MAAVPMSQRIESERKDMKLGEVKELNLDGCTASEIEGLTDEYSSLESLSLVNVGLTSLAAMPALPALCKINAAENPISAGLEALAKCSHLASINLSGNKFAAISDLSPLAALESLTHLELNNCELASIENYRKEVFAILPNLKFLDGLDQNGQEDGAAAPVEAGDESNGVSNGHAAENTEEGDGDEDDEDDDDDDDEEEEIGISALQGSKELDDDEEDYVPGAENEDEDIEDGDEDDDDEEGDEDDEDVDEGEVANLSGAGVTGPRRAAKRPAEDAEPEEASEAKCPAPDAGGDATNGDA